MTMLLQEHLLFLEKLKIDHENYPMWMYQHLKRKDLARKVQ